jgi:phosphatidylglycerol---prolipoprotein diacylglyceryl transferase
VIPAYPRLHIVFEITGYVFAAGLYLWLRSRQHDTIDDRSRATVLTGAALGAAIGTRLLFWLSYPDVPITGFFSGKTIVGGLLGGLIGVEVAKALAGLKRSTGDLFVFPILVALSIGRIGCFLAGPVDRTEGVASDLPWAIAVGDGVRRHPVALYEIVFLLLLIPLLRFVHRTSPYEGDMFRTFMLAYLAFRFSVDFIKPDPPPLAGGMTAIQYACLGGIAYYCFILMRRSSRRAIETAR